MTIKKLDAESKIDETKTTRIWTNQKLTLQNFIKGQEDIDYKTVKTLGKDTNGTPITARFEWDYKKQTATVYVTSRTTAEDLAHEFGHYFDRKLSSEIGTKLSDIIPNYAENKPNVDNSLAAYAIARNGETPRLNKSTQPWASL